MNVACSRYSLCLSCFIVYLFSYSCVHPALRCGAHRGTMFARGAGLPASLGSAGPLARSPCKPVISLHPSDEELTSGAMTEHAATAPHVCICKLIA